MNKLLLSYLLFIVPCFADAQQNDATAVLLRKLDSLQTSSSVSRHFAALYFNTTAKALDYFSKKDKKIQDFMQRLELRFAGYFFAAADAHNSKNEIPQAWKTYYADSSLTRVQYFLFGANAHINGDIWQAMTAEFSLAELKEFKKEYYRYNRKLKEELFFVYNSAFNTVPKVRLLHGFTFGFDRSYAKLMLVRWRKRQMKLSGLWFSDKEKFTVKLGDLKKKMAAFDKLVLQNL
ncbi:MAG: DUF5995 family protein [Bacteroidota bacterium]